MKLLVDIGKAYSALSSYDCRKAIELLENLPLHQLSTSWVMDKLAISYYECGENDMVSIHSFIRILKYYYCYVVVYYCFGFDYSLYQIFCTFCLLKIIGNLSCYLFVVCKTFFFLFPF